MMHVIAFWLIGLLLGGVIVIAFFLAPYIGLRMGARVKNVRGVSE
jgi:hypothetical protein